MGKNHKTTVVVNEGKKTPKETLWQKIKHGF